MNLVSFKDANGGVINVNSLRIAFSNMNSQPTPVTKERSRLHNSVNITTDPNNIVVKIGNILNWCIEKNIFLYLKIKIFHIFKNLYFFFYFVLAVLRIVFT